MKREWYLIDDDGIHPLDLDDETADDQSAGDGDAPWPPFNQLVVEASPEETLEALGRTAPRLGIELVDVTGSPEQWDRAVVLTRASNGLVAIGEPGVDVDERVVALEWSDALVEELACSGALFGYDPAAQTLHLTRYTDGELDFAWCDSLVPGPSYVMRFDDGEAISQGDPRKFALRRLGLPETSPFVDRYDFVISELRQLGLEQISPELDDLPVAAAMSVQFECDTEGERGSSR